MKKIRPSYPGARLSRLVAVGSIVTLTVGLFGWGSGAARASTIDIFNPQEVLNIVSEKLMQAPAQNLTDSKLSVEATGTISLRARNATSTGISVAAPATAAMTDAAAKSGASISTNIELSVPFATRVVSETSDTVVAATTEDNVALYIQPTSQGARLMTVLADDSAPSSYTYHLAVPQETTARSRADGGLDLVNSEGLSVGSIRAAWAKDANGISVPTSYEWKDGSLVQHIDLSNSKIAYPVVADPAWDYTVGWMIETKSVPQVRSMLYSCFNCYFPVAFAPASFPAYNQFLPLEVGPIPGVLGWNFNCYMDTTTWYNSGGGMAVFSFRFRAAPGHVDGEGSTITFNFNPAWKQDNPGNKFTQLIVYAYIMNDNPMGIGQPAYIAGAWYNWGAFAGNLRTG